MSFRVAMDIGGTFTDFVVYDGSNGGAVSSGKVLTTPPTPPRACSTACSSSSPSPAGLEFLVHGTTVGLNAFLERKGTRPLLVMTAGLRDAYSIARHDRKELYALRYHKPERLVPRRDVIEVVERLRWDGSVDVPLDRASVDGAGRAAARGPRRGGRDLPAPLVRQPRPRARAARRCSSPSCPELSITLSHEIAREWREYERASTAVLNAYIAPRVERYLGTLERELARLGIRARCM